MNQYENFEILKVVGHSGTSNDIKVEQSTKCLSAKLSILETIIACNDTHIVSTIHEIQEHHGSLVKGTLNQFSPQVHHSSRVNSVSCM